MPPHGGPAIATDPKSGLQLPEGDSGRTPYRSDSPSFDQRSTMTSLPQQARSLERDFFGALLGLLAGAIVARLLLLFVDINLFVLGAIVLTSGWSAAMLFHFSSHRSATALASMQGMAERVRTACLKAVLWLLGIAAVLGVLSVLTGSFDVIGRVAGTAAVTALAAALMWPFLIMLDDQKQWRIGMFGIANVVAAFFLVTPAIWQIGHRSIETSVTALILILMLPAGVIGLRMVQERKTRASGLLTTALYLAGTGLFLGSAWSHQWRLSEELVGTGFTVLGFGVLAVLALLGAFDNHDRRHWRWIGVVAAFLAASMLIYNIWQLNLFDEKWIIVVGSVAAVVAHGILSCLAPLTGTQKLWRYGTIAAVITTAVAFDLEIVMTNYRRAGISLLGRVALASGILASTGSLAMLILARLSRRRQQIAVSPHAITSVFLSCPRCGRQQSVILENGRCQQCELSIQITIPTELGGGTDSDEQAKPSAGLAANESPAADPPM